MRWLGPAVLAVALSGCAAPRVITSITGSQDELKFIYARVGGFTSETRRVRCYRAADGALSNCKNIPITFEEGN